jgi:hypothetical protein
LPEKHVSAGGKSEVFWRAIGGLVFETRQNTRLILLIDTMGQFLKSIRGNTLSETRKGQGRKKQTKPLGSHFE